jgi:dTDP-4-dehydrorhamnose reductase
MKVLVTGAGGQVGQALKTECEKQNIQFEGFDRASLDITDAAQVMALINDSDADAVINAAAYTAVDRAEEDSDAAFAINEQAVGYLASACASNDLPFLHISTDFVFDGTKDSRYVEDDICAPLSVYGNSKWRGEALALQNCAQSLILRTSWVFGGEQNFVQTMRRLGAERGALSVVDDQRGGPTAAIDIAQTLLKMAAMASQSDFDQWGIYHYSGGPAVSWYEFACEILKDNAGVRVSSIPSSDYPTPATRPANSVLDCSKMKRVFGISQPQWKNRL